MKSEMLKLAFYGDFCSYFPEKQTIGKQLQDLIDRQDLNVVNFEGCLQYGRLHTVGRFYLRQSQNSPCWLKKHGFNVVNLANNHAYDWGEEGLCRTQEAFDGVEVLGCGYWDEAYSVRFIELKGYKLGFFSATSADLSSLKDKWTDQKRFGCPWINHFSVDNVLREAKKRCDYLFVMVHAGVEYMSVPLPEWRDRYRQLIDVGVDAVIATHPHVPQGVEYYKGKIIFYSLGNFCFDKGVESEIPYWNNGVVACIKLFNKKVDVQVYLTKLEGHEIEIDNHDKAKEHFRSLCDVLMNDEKYIDRVNKEVLCLYSKYEKWLLSGLQASKSTPRSMRLLFRFLKAFLCGNENYRLALHQIREESTRWVLARAYKLLSNTEL